MISSRHIEVFYHVYNEGSLTRAAKILNVSQPLVSKTLAYAEHKLKLKLFVRHARRLSPTPEADILFKHAGLLPSLLNKYLKNHPQVKFNIVNLQTLELEEQLKELTFDMVICFNPSDSDLFNKIILHSGSLVLIAPKNKAPKNKIFKLSEIKDEPFIKIKNLKTNASQNNLDEVLKQQNINVNWVAETETIQVAKAMVEKGSGYSIIDDLSAEVYGEGISVHEIEPKIGYKICMMSNKEKPLSVSAKKFISHLSDLSTKT